MLFIDEKNALRQSMYNFVLFPLKPHIYVVLWSALRLQFLFWRFLMITYFFDKAESD